MGSVWRRLGAAGHGARGAAGVPRRGRRAPSPRKRCKLFTQAGPRDPHRRRRSPTSTSASRTSRSSTTMPRASAQSGDVRPPDRVDRPHAAHRGLGADKVGLQLDERGFVERRRRLPHQPRQRLGDRRRRARPDARAQGRGRGRGGRRAHRGPARPRRLQHRSVGDLHVAGNRVGRQDRAAVQGGRRGVPGGPFPFSANGRARAMGDTTGFVKILADAAPTASSACTSIGPHGLRADRRRRGGDGVRRVERGPRAHLPRASVAVGGDARKRRWPSTAGR